MTIRAIYEDGVFKPAGPVGFPDKAEVELEARMLDDDSSESLDRAKTAQRKIDEILSRRYDTGQTDTAARHDEHQP
jgi:predicted DNA-binding antitoxin AbrB/MazE fold protein